MKVSCPTCSTLIPGGQLNVATDVAYCEQCGEAFSLSDLIAAGQDAQEYENIEAPSGVWFDETYFGWKLGASTRSAIAFFLVPFMCVWSGGSLGGIYGMQIINGEFNLLLSLFGIPFVLGTLLFGSLAVMSVCGKIVVSVENGAGKVFEGVGPIGWTRNFDWNSVKRIEEDFRIHRSSNNTHTQTMLVLVGSTRLRFGSMLPEARRVFLMQTLRKLLATRSIKQR